MFQIECSIVNNELPARAGFAHDKANGRWVTPFAAVAWRVAKLAGRETREIIEAKKKSEDEKVIRSQSTYSNTYLPIPVGEKLRPYQVAGVDWIIENDRAGIDTLLGDEMGLGKTPQAIVACNVLRPSRVLIICPASPKINWLREWKRWSTLGLSVGIASGKYFPGTQVVIINYDILARYADSLKAITWSLLIADEVQYIKNPKAGRTREICGGRFFKKVEGRKRLIKIDPIRARRTIMLTGTPIPNKVMEMFGVLRHLYRFGFPSEHYFGVRYCAGEWNRDTAQWEYGGASNLDELRHKLRSTIMIRRLKADVLHDLPAKVRQVIELDPEKGVKSFLRKDETLWNKISASIGIIDDNNLNEREFREVIKIMQDGESYGFEEMATVRKETGVLTAPMAIGHIKDVLENNDKVIVFAWHTEVIDMVKKEFGKVCVTLTGSTPNKKRQEAVDRFQNDPLVKLFVGNIRAAGVAITLTAASLIVFIEEDWVPPNITQAEDRAHRIGQAKSLLVQHLVLRGSMTARMIKRVIRKQEETEEALDPIADEELRRILS